MRMSLARAATCFGLVILSAGGCEVGDGTVPGGDDDGTTDDSITDGLPGPDAADLPDPALAVAVDKTTISTELMSENMVTLTLQGSDGFAGPVAIAASAVGPGGAPLTDWDVVLSDTSVTLTENGTATVVATLSIPSDAATLAGRIKFDVTSSLVPAQTTQTEVTALNQVTLGVKLNGGGNACIFPAGVTNTTVNVGTKVRFANTDTVPNHLVTIHVDGGGTGIAHQPDGGTMPGGAYEQIAENQGTASWYCHAPSTDPGNLTITVQ